MRKNLLLLATALFCLVAPRLQAEVTVQLFYDQLGNDGDWIQTDEYGYVFHPHVHEDWRPYTEGHWVYTDDGWTFVSDEHFGWATYHYGRWAREEEVGWVWVPDTEWAPAWVSWRHNDRYLGWAPLPPEARFENHIAIESYADSYYDIGPEDYSFVETRRFGDENLNTVVLRPEENINIITETTNITNITYRNDSVFVGGPDYATVSRTVERPIPQLQLERRTDVTVNQSGGYSPRIQGNRLQVAAPALAAAPANVAPPHVARTISQAKFTHGWSGISDQAKAQQFRQKLQSQAKIPAGLPPKPTYQRPGGGAGGNSTAGGAPATPAAANAMERNRTPGDNSGAGARNNAMTRGATTEQGATTPNGRETTPNTPNEPGTPAAENARGVAKGRKGKPVETLGEGTPAAGSEATSRMSGARKNTESGTASAMETPGTAKHRKGEQAGNLDAMTREPKEGSTPSDATAGRTPSERASESRSKSPGEGSAMEGQGTDKARRTPPDRSAESSSGASREDAAAREPGPTSRAAAQTERAASEPKAERRASEPRSEEPKAEARSSEPKSEARAAEAPGRAAGEGKAAAHGESEGKAGKGEKEKGAPQA